MVCITPYWVQPKIGPKVPVPCGKCLPCVKRHSSQWAIRLMCEATRSVTAYFLTFTYENQNVPITENGFMTLRPKDMQDYMKRLRKLHFRKLKYYLVGEYGSQSMRPHYHMLLFNADVEKIQLEWKYGQIDYGEVEGASIAYTLKYMHKKGKIPIHDRDDREKEFARMSKGIGENYLTDEMRDWHLTKPDRLYCVTVEGYKVSMPRYYKDRIFSDQNFESMDMATAVRKRADLVARYNAMRNQIKNLNKLKGDPAHNELQLHLAMQHIQEELAKKGGKI